MLTPLLLLAAQLLQSGSDTTGVMAAGISRELATRRATDIRDVRYALDLDVTRLDSARGVVRVTFALRRPTDVILDFRGPALSGAVVNSVALSSAEWNGKHLR